MKNIAALTLVLSMFPCWSVNAEPAPDYVRARLKPGTLSSVGSDSMNDIMEDWVEAYENLQPAVEVNLVSRGSALAPAALIDGSANLGPMARPMKEDELELFVARFGFEPTQIRTAVATVAVYVSDENPITELTLSELDSIFSRSVSRSERAAKLWSEVSEDSAADEIVPVAVLETSPLSLYFRQKVMLQGYFRDGISRVSGAESIFKAIENDKSVIGFGPLVEPPKGVKLVAVKNTEAGKAAIPLADIQDEMAYPLSRFLNLYVVQKPGEKLDSKTSDFLAFILSRQGQELVESSGLLKLSKELLKKELTKISKSK